jgi:methionine sulfoxide reductase heme-binding subunit
MKKPEPINYLWWLVSRASGILALVLISLSVLMGLAMAAKVLHRPGLKRVLVRLHEHIALVALLAIALHGLALLGDHWLKPGWRGITVPFAMSYRPQFTGLGVLAGYLAVLVGPSFYLRRRIGAGRWRTLHRATTVVWALSVVHTIGAGSDGSKLWLRVIVLGTGVPIVYLLVVRVLSGGGSQRAPGAREGAPGSGGRTGRGAHPAGHTHARTSRAERRPVGAQQLAEETP